MAQGRALIANLSDGEYVATPQAFKASSIGAHYRHHLEHVQLLLWSEPHDVVDYNARPREKRLEQSCDAALTRTDRLIEDLEALDPSALDRPLVMAHRTNPEEGPVEAETTLRRELLFMVSHAVHHFALMKIIAEVHGQQLCDSFGVMPSTLAHLASND